MKKQLCDLHDRNMRGASCTCVARPSNPNTYLPDRPELSERGRQDMQEKFARRNPQQACYAHMSDEWVANAVYMVGRNDLDLAAIQEAGRDRIMHLSLRVAALERGADETRAGCPHYWGTHDKRCQLPADHLGEHYYLVPGPAISLDVDWRPAEKANAEPVRSNWNPCRGRDGWDCWTCGAFITHKQDVTEVERDCLKCGPNAVNGTEQA